MALYSCAINPQTKSRLTLCRVKEFSLQMVKLTFLLNGLCVEHGWLMGRMVRIVGGMVLVHSVQHYGLES